MRLSSKYLALLIVPLVATGLATSPAQATSSFAVSAIMSTTSVTLGQTLTLHGAVYPGSPGKRVTVQVRQPGSSAWSTLKTATLSSKSQYSVLVRPTKAGATGYRVLKPSSSVHNTGISAIRTVTGWRWRTFASLPLIDFAGNVGTTDQASVTLDGQTFAPAVIQDPEGTRLYDTQGRCSKLDAWVSGDPTSADDSTEFAHVYGDQVADQGSYTLDLATNQVHRDGSPVHIVLGSATMNQVWSLQIYSNGVEAGNKVAWGNPRVYCRF